MSPSFTLAQESGGSKTTTPEEEDFSNTPYTSYGSFSGDDEEEEDTKFFQYGRFFGLSIGAGFEHVTGNRGRLWNGGFPLVDLKLHYWFDFNLALDFGFSTVSHNYEGVNGAGNVDVNILRLGFDVKYYFDVRDVSAAISFANPYVLLGAGLFKKTENSPSTGVTSDPDSPLGACVGAGLEFAVKPKKVYLTFEGKVNLVRYKDSGSSDYAAQGLDDLSGMYYTGLMSVLFTW